MVLAAALAVLCVALAALVRARRPLERFAATAPPACHCPEGYAETAPGSYQCARRICASDERMLPDGRTCEPLAARSEEISITGPATPFVPCAGLPPMPVYNEPGAAYCTHACDKTPGALLLHRDDGTYACAACPEGTTRVEYQDSKGRPQVRCVACAAPGPIRVLDPDAPTFTCRGGAHPTRLHPTDLADCTANT